MLKVLKVLKVLYLHLGVTMPAAAKGDPGSRTGGF